MKNRALLFEIILLGVTIIFLAGCATQVPVVEQQQSTPTTNVEKQKPEIWKQSKYPGLSLRDSVLFYNSAEIRIEGSFFNQTFFVRNGVVNAIDSTNSVSKIVQVETPGGLIDMRKDKGGRINVMFISFSKNEATYNFSFYRVEDGSFVLNGKAELVFKGKKYPVVASTIGASCKLLFYFNKQEIKNEIKETAPGWQLGDSYETESY